MRANEFIQDTFLRYVVHHKGVETFPKLRPAYKYKEVSWFANNSDQVEGEDVLTFDVWEKLDGANARIYKVPGTNTLRLYSRGTYVGEVRSSEDYDGDFRGFIKYVADNYDVYASLIPEDYMIYGEWLVKHSVQYPDSMYGMFYAFRTDQKAVLPVPSTEHLGTLTLPANPSKEDHQKFVEAISALLEDYEKSVNRPVEGAVLYYKGTPWFKLVPERLRETPTSTSAAKSKLPQKEFVFDEIPQRTLEKRLHDTLDRLNINSVDEISDKQISAIFGILSHLAWEDFVRELLPDAILNKKNKNISMLNLKHLRNHVNSQVRKYLKDVEIL